MKQCFFVFLVLLTVPSLFPLSAQTSQDSITFRASVISNLLRRERVFLHFDNTGYYLGETMWFKAYVTTGDKNLTDMSKVLYIELVAPEGYVVETKKYKLENGTCNGEFTLHPLLLSGYYEIRAYTRYMLNWGKDAAFSRVIPIYDKVNGDNYDFRNMLDRKRGFMYRGEWITSEAKDISLSFYPEGGNLVYGMESLVAYELKDENGRELQAIVSILENGKDIINSTPQYMGKGTFKIKPGQGKKYTAEVIYGKKKKKFDFLDIHKEGARIAVKENGEKIEISVAHNMQDTQTAGCVIFANDKIIAYRQIEKNENLLTFEKEKLPIGVNRAILFINNLML